MRTYSFNQAVMAASYGEIPAKVMVKIEKKTTVLARKLSRALRKRERLQPSFKTKFLFNVMKMAKKGHPEWNALDHQFWMNSGYFLSGKPWRDTLEPGSERG